MGQMTRFAGLETTGLKLGGRRKRSLERTCRLVAFVPTFGLMHRRDGNLPTRCAASLGK